MRQDCERSHSIVTPESSGHGRPPCIAVVEDDTLVRRAWCEAVTAGGYEVLEAADGTELLAHLREARPKLILLDMLLPKIDGFEILARLRADAEWTDVPILVVSELSETLAEAVDTESAQRLRIVGFLPKSVSLDTLLGHLARIVGEPGAVAEPAASGTHLRG
jgi:CheY-like chemotaxis protein